MVSDTRYSFLGRSPNNLDAGNIILHHPSFTRKFIGFIYYYTFPFKSLQFHHHYETKEIYVRRRWMTVNVHAHLQVSFIMSTSNWVRDTRMLRGANVTVLMDCIVISSGTCAYAPPDP